MAADTLPRLTQQVIACRQCDILGISVLHPRSMNRGEGRFGMVVGIEPGKTELNTGEAFTGLAGRRLMQWLEKAGLGETRERIFEHVYFTSLTKCHVEDKKRFKAAVANCSGFLKRQLELIRPKVCVTLGKDPITMMFGTARPLEEMVGNTFREDELNNTLFPFLPRESLIIPFPHPSPKSYWLNDEENKRKLERSIEKLAKIWEVWGMT